MDYKKAWQILLFEMEIAIDEGQHKGFDVEKGTIDRGMYDAYKMVYDRMKSLVVES